MANDQAIARIVREPKTQRLSAALLVVIVNPTLSSGPRELIK